MPASAARIAANQQNAAHSTGPKTAEGKARSRSNALKHGNYAETLRAPDPNADAPVAATAAVTPADPWVRQEVVVLRTQIDQAHQVETSERALAAARAETAWEADRRVEVERVAAGLERRPERVVALLRASPQGCDWLTQRWRWLRRAARRMGGWTQGQATLARQLRGTPDLFHAETQTINAVDQIKEAEAAIGELKTHRVSLEAADALRRDAVRNGVDDTASPGLRRAIRHTATLFRRLQWCQPAPSVAAAPAPAVAPVVTAPPLAATGWIMGPPTLPPSPDRFNLLDINPCDDEIAAIAARILLPQGASPRFPTLPTDRIPVAMTSRPRLPKR